MENARTPISRRRGPLALVVGAVAGVAVAGAAYATSQPDPAKPANVSQSAGQRLAVAQDVEEVAAADAPALLAWEAPAVPKTKPKVKVVQRPAKVVYVAAESSTPAAQPASQAAPSDDDAGDVHEDEGSDDHGDEGSEDHGDEREDGEREEGDD